MVKKILLTALFSVLIGGSSFLAAEESVLKGFNQSWTVHELAASESVPVKQLTSNLGLDFADIRNRSLSDLGITRQDAESALARYKADEPGMVSSIVLVGMLIVFASLVVVAFFISLFKHLHIFEKIKFRRKTQTAETEVGVITSRGDMSENALAAVITAIFLHEEEVDSENRLLLTWKRVSARAWKTGEEMPNALHFATRRGR